MTAERLSHVEYEVDPEELVRLLAAPIHRDPREITDPIALFGTTPVEHDPHPGAPLPSALTLAA